MQHFEEYPREDQSLQSVYATDNPLYRMRVKHDKSAWQHDEGSVMGAKRGVLRAPVSVTTHPESTGRVLWSVKHRLEDSRGIA